MASPSQTHKRGTMDIREHQATYALFWTLTKVGIVGVILLLVFLAYFFT